MAETVRVETPQGRGSITELLGLGLLRTAWRLLRSHGWKLVAIAACAYAAHEVVMDVAVWFYQFGAVPGFLAFSLVPVVPLFATALGLLTLRRHQERSGAGALVTALGAVLIPYLVVYETQGGFREDLSTFLNGGFNSVSEREAAAELAGQSGDPNAYDSLVPEFDSALVLGVVLAAFLLRVVGARLAERETLWRSGRIRWVRGVLRVLAGYSEIVWIVLGAATIRFGLENLRGWWTDRRLGRAVSDWWEGFQTSLPDLAGVFEGLLTVLLTVLDGVVTGLLTPVAWLAIGVVVFGRSAAATISDDEVLSSVRGGQRLGRVAQRVNPGVITVAWHRIASTEGRFGALLGGIAMIVRSRYAPVLTFCLVYTLLSTWSPYLVWDVASSVLSQRIAYVDWLAFYGPLQAVASIVTFCLVTPLLAAFADALLTRFGAASQLRLPDQPIGS